MSKMKSYDLAMMLIEEVNENADGCGVSVRLLEEFRYSCKLMDEISDEHEGIAYGCEIDEDELDITMSVDCPYFEVLNANGPFYRLMRRSKRFTMNTSPEDEENVRLSFTMDGVWVNE